MREIHYQPNKYNLIKLFHSIPLLKVYLCFQTGYIRTTDYSYYIEPAEVYTNKTTGSIMHRMQKLRHPSKEDEFTSPESPEFFENNGKFCNIIQYIGT